MKRIGRIAVGALCVSAACANATEVSVVETRGDVNAAVRRVAAAGGGRVVIPKGDWLTPSVKLSSNVELHLAEGARLVASTNRTDYTSLNLPYCEGDLMAVVTAVGVTNVSVTGTGEIFGNGQAWPQPGNYGGNQEGLRPRGLVFANCRDVRLADFTLRDSPCWGIVLKNCDGVVARRVRVDSHANANNDGFDIEARNVLIENCDVDSGDDAFCLKSNDPGFVMENVTIRRCVGRSNCNAFKIGTASHGVVRHVRFEDCRTEAPRRDFLSRIAKKKLSPGEPWFYRNRTREWHGPESLAGMAGLAIECVDGGEVSDVVCRGFGIRGMMAPIFVRGGTRTGRSCGTPPGNRYVLRDICISDVTAVAASPIASSLTGVTGCRPQNVLLENVTIRCAPGALPARKGPVPERAGRYPEGNMFGLLPTKGLYIRHADGVTLKNVVINGADGEGVVCDDVPGFRRIARGDAARAVTVPCAWTDAAGRTFRYRYHAPARVESGRSYPLVVLMHGAGERGTNNVDQLAWGADELVSWFAARGEEFFFVAGQVPKGKRWVEVDWSLTEHVLPECPSETMALQIAFLEKLLAERPEIDRSRVYVTGISMGGYGTWDILCRRPDWFAAAMPICGGCDVAQAPRLRDIPIWVYHGDRDATVPFVRSRKMTSALWSCGGNVKYTEYPGVGHDSWKRAYGTSANLDWLFSQRKAK